jgi:hypothetical protein
MSLTDFFYSTIYGGDTINAQGDSLDKKIAAANESDYSPGGRIYNEIVAQRGVAAADETYQTVLGDEASGSTANLIATGDKNYDDAQAGGGNGLSNLFGDLTSLILLGAGLWAFFTFGGVNWLKSVTKGTKYGLWIVLAGGAALVWFILTKLKKTATDASDTASNIGSSIKKII